MHSIIITASDEIATNRHETVWNRFVRMVALAVIFVTGNSVATVQFAHADAYEEFCLAATDGFRQSPDLRWLVTVHLNTAGDRETQPDSLSEESASDDEYRDPFEEISEPVEDPWEAFNTRIFSFNLSVDRYVWKPIATGYDWIVPDPVEQAIGQAFDNVRFVPRFVNNLFQGKGTAAGIELGRFLINSTIGLAGFFDVAQAGFGIDSPEAEDTGQTLAVHGVQSGPYLVLPFLPPTTVRDGIGSLGDLVLDPLNLLLPFGPQIGTRASQAINDRSHSLDRFEGVEEATVDLYAAVRGAYQQTRAKAIRE